MSENNDSRATVKTAREMAIDWLYPDGAPNPAALRRDAQVGMLTRRFQIAMNAASKDADEHIAHATAELAKVALVLEEIALTPDMTLARARKLAKTTLGRP